jgi:hypothetical protein
LIRRSKERSKVKKYKNNIMTFDLMNDLLATSVIMRSKVLMHWWLIIRAKN